MKEEEKIDPKVLRGHLKLLAQKTGCSISYVSQIVNGHWDKRETPTVRKIKKEALKLQKSLKEMYG